MLLMLILLSFIENFVMKTNKISRRENIIQFTFIVSVSALQSLWTTAICSSHHQLPLQSNMRKEQSQDQLLSTPITEKGYKIFFLFFFNKNMNLNVSILSFLLNLCII